MHQHPPTSHCHRGYPQPLMSISLKMNFDWWTNAYYSREGPVQKYILYTTLDRMNYKHTYLYVSLYTLQDFAYQTFSKNMTQGGNYRFFVALEW